MKVKQNKKQALVCRVRGKFLRISYSKFNTLFHRSHKTDCVDIWQFVFGNACLAISLHVSSGHEDPFFERKNNPFERKSQECRYKHSMTLLFPCPLYRCIFEALSTIKRSTIKRHTHYNGTLGQAKICPYPEAEFTKNDAMFLWHGCKSKWMKFWFVLRSHGGECQNYTQLNTLKNNCLYCCIYLYTCIRWTLHHFWWIFRNMTQTDHSSKQCWFLHRISVIPLW